MKKRIKSWTLKLLATSMFLMTLLFILVMNPSFMYANTSVVGKFVVHHNEDLSPDMSNRLENVSTLLRQSEIFDADFGIQVCLNDGSAYPSMLEKLRGHAFAWGFHDKIVLQSDVDWTNNHAIKNAYTWNLEELIAHEAIHCFQYKKFGFLNSNPVASYPTWKWEGYPEYISRFKDSPTNWQHQYSLLIEAQENNAWSIDLPDGTMTPTSYFEDYLLVKFCLNIKNLNYIELLDDSTEKEALMKEMMFFAEGE